MEVVFFAIVLGGVVGVVFRETFGRARALRWLAIASAIAASVCFLGATRVLSAADDAKPAAAPTDEPTKKEFVKPDNWPQGHPLPIVESNCATCHLTAGRELTAAVVNFTRSVHDLDEMSCADCHGGNTEDDASAHEGEFDFIGTKKSAHIETCSGCHDEEAEVLAGGPHGWDFSKRINTEFPMCFDCHGNHDIGRPPADFELALWCADCHDQPDKTFGNLASVVDQNDRLWSVLRKVQQKNIASIEHLVPQEFREEVDGLRAATMRVIHRSKEISADEAGKLNRRAIALRTALEMWLQSNP